MPFIRVIILGSRLCASVPLWPIPFVQKTAIRKNEPNETHIQNQKLRSKPAYATLEKAKNRYHVILPSKGFL